MRVTPPYAALCFTLASDPSASCSATSDFPAVFLPSGDDGTPRRPHRRLLLPLKQAYCTRERHVPRHAPSAGGHRKWRGGARILVRTWCIPLHLCDGGWRPVGNEVRSGDDPVVLGSHELRPAAAVRARCGGRVPKVVEMRPPLARAVARGARCNIQHTTICVGMSRVGVAWDVCDLFGGGGCSGGRVHWVWAWGLHG